MKDPDDGEGRLPVGLFASVDTTAGGFTALPCYTARICGPRPLEVELPGEFESPGTTVQVLDGPAYVVSPSPTGFECYVPLCELGGRPQRGRAQRGPSNRPERSGA